MDDFSENYKKKILNHKNFPKTPRGEGGRFFIPEEKFTVIGEDIQTAYLKGDFVNSNGENMYFYAYIDRERNTGKPHSDNLIIGARFYDRPVSIPLRVKREPLPVEAVSI